MNQKIKIQNYVELIGVGTLLSVVAVMASAFGPIANTICVHQNLQSAKKNFGKIPSSYKKAAVLSYIRQIPVYNKMIADIYQESMKNIKLSGISRLRESAAQHR